MFLLSGHSILLIATNWRRYHLPCAFGWASSYETQIQQFKENISPDVIISETIELRLAFFTTVQICKHTLVFNAEFALQNQTLYNAWRNIFCEVQFSKPNFWLWHAKRKFKETWNLHTKCFIFYKYKILYFFHPDTFSYKLQKKCSKLWNTWELIINLYLAIVDAYTTVAS